MGLWAKTKKNYTNETRLVQVRKRSSQNRHYDAHKEKKKNVSFKKNKKTSVFEAPSFYPACFIVPPRKVIYKRFFFHSYNSPLTKKKILPHGQVRSVFCIAVKLRSHLQKLSSLLLRPPVRSVFCIAVTDVMNRSVWGRIFLTYADVC